MKNNSMKLALTRGLSILTYIFLIFITSASVAQRPNILFIISDDLNTRIGPYMDIDKHTPNLDRLATKGIRFSRSYCQYPVCGPSRASMMSGLYPETNRILKNEVQLSSIRVENPSLANHPSLAGF